MAERLIAKKNVYADVPEDGGPVRRLVAAEGQPVPAAFADLVDAADVVNERDRTRVAAEDVYADVDEGLGTVVRRKVAAEGQPVPAAFADHVDDGQTTVVEHDPGATRNAIATAAAGGATNTTAEVVEEIDVDELKGEALEEKLDELGLSKSGTADEKRARVAEAIGDAR